MSNIFIFTAGKAVAREHLDVSIRNPIFYQRIRDTLNEIDHGKLFGHSEKPLVKFILGGLYLEYEINPTGRK